MSDASRSSLPGYYAFVRREIEPLLPARADHVLEVGCGQGDTLAWLKDRGIAARTTGIELDAASAAAARGCVDHLIEGKSAVLQEQFTGGGKKDTVSRHGLFFRSPAFLDRNLLYSSPGAQLLCRHRRHRSPAVGQAALEWCFSPVFRCSFSATSSPRFPPFSCRMICI